jgi:hypothetical protein
MRMPVLHVGKFEDAREISRPVRDG